MRSLFLFSFLPSCGIILTSCLFPQSFFAFPIYIGIILYGTLMMVGVYRKSAPKVKWQIQLAATGALFTPVGVGVFFCLR
jgi:hypothetical protein